MEIAQKLKIDNTYIYMDSSKGWKLSRFVDNAVELDYGNTAHVKKALKLLKKLHEAEGKTKYVFDVRSEEHTSELQSR